MQTDTLRYGNSKRLNPMILPTEGIFLTLGPSEHFSEMELGSLERELNTPWPSCLYQTPQSWDILGTTKELAACHLDSASQGPRHGRTGTRTGTAPREWWADNSVRSQEERQNISFSRGSREGRKYLLTCWDSMGPPQNRVGVSRDERPGIMGNVATSLCTLRIQHHAWCSMIWTICPAPLVLCVLEIRDAPVTERYI